VVSTGYRSIPAGTYYPQVRRPAAHRKARGRGLRAIPWWGWLLLSPVLLIGVALATAIAVASGGLAVVVGAAIGAVICQPRVGRKPNPQNRVRVGKTQDEIRRAHAKRINAARR
jgi:hypothetical protein